MNTERIVYGDIGEIKTKNSKTKQDVFLGCEDAIFSVEVTQEQIYESVRKKVVLVEIVNKRYVELAKLKSYKDLIKAYLELFLNGDNSKYILKESNVSNGKYIKANSIIKYDGDLNQNESIKSLRKKILNEEK